jgi:seryl-tRNA synthetase
MLDAVFVRDNLSEVEARLRARGLDPSKELAAFATLEAERRRLIPLVETLKRDQNTAGDAVARAKKEGRDPSDVFTANKARGVEIRLHETALAEIEQKRADLLLTLPNLPHASVPDGRSAADNVEVRRWGTPREFDFEPKAHWDIGAALGILDFERAARMSGARFSVLLGAGARLARGLINFMLDLHTREHGYREVEPPFLVNRAALTGTGNLPKFEQDLFKLPLKYTAYTPCFRSEAGSYGADVRGLIRQHQFDKVELVKITTAEQSHEELEGLTRNAETILERLGLPYRRMLLCTGDMGFASAKTYDLEVWLPSQKTFREISSCSNTEAFQARRAQIRYRPDGGGKNQFAHTLNGSGLAVGRTLIAVLENGQQADGSVVIPEALRPYVGMEAITP